MAALHRRLHTCSRNSDRKRADDRAEEGGARTISCLHTGLDSDLHDCGTPDWYDYVFRGTISSIQPREGVVSSQPLQNDEKILQITTDEIFKGSPAHFLSVKTSQALCFPELRAGDEWLFFLRKPRHGPVVLDFYANDSLPLSLPSTQARIATLRRLKTLGGSALIEGEVVQAPYGGGSPVRTRVTATRASDRSRILTESGADGRFVFPPLPSGTYTVGADSAGIHPFKTAEIPLAGGRCWNVALRPADAGPKLWAPPKPPGNP